MKRAISLVLLATLAFIGLMAPPAAQAATTRQQIVNVATGQLGGTACNPGYYNSCGIEWCAEFSRWVWRTAGVSDTTGLDSWAHSFKTYGLNRGLYRARSSGYQPQPGDAIVFDWDRDPGDAHPIDHVAIVTSSTASTVYIIGGNQGGTDKYNSSVTARSYSRSDIDIDGYVLPAGLGGDGVAIWRASTGSFHIDDSLDGYTDGGVLYGSSGDWPLMGDWGGVGRDGVGVWRASSGTFYLDDDRDGATDQWIVYGGSTDVPVTGDWDGDGRDGVGVWRASSGTFYLDNDGNGTTDQWIVYGGSADVPVTGDWDGDGRDGVGAWRASSGTFYLDNDGNGTTDVWVVYGGATDVPIA